MALDVFYERAYAIWEEAEKRGIEIPHTPDPVGRMLSLATTLGVPLEMVLDPEVAVADLFTARAQSSS